MGQEDSSIFSGSQQAKTWPWATECPEMRDQSLREAERLALHNAKADQLGLWALADISMPADVREYAERHKMPEFGAQFWRSAFVAGFRAAIRAMGK